MEINYSKSQRIVIIGSGKRVQRDFLPVISTLPSYQIAGIFSKNEKKISVDNLSYDIKNIKELTSDFFSNNDLVYVAIPPTEVPKILTFLSQVIDGRKLKISLLIDTPAASFKSLRILSKLSMFSSVFVAEDSVYLPWVNNAKIFLKDIKQVFFDQSACDYHAIALAKIITSSKLFFGFRFGKKIMLYFSGGKKVCITEPRDYSRGVVNILNNDQCLSSKKNTTVFKCDEIKLILNGNKCLGVACGDRVDNFTQEESDLLGSVEDQDNVVTKMLKIKRIGLRRLLNDFLTNQQAYSFENGLEDALAHYFLKFFRVWISVGLLNPVKLISMIFRVKKDV